MYMYMYSYGQTAQCIYSVVCVCLPKDDLVENAVEVEGTEVVEDGVGGRADLVRVLAIEQTQLRDHLVELLQLMHFIRAELCVGTLRGRGGRGGGEGRGGEGGE